jgi:hypothetical protein
MHLTGMRVIQYGESVEEEDWKWPEIRGAPRRALEPEFTWPRTQKIPRAGLVRQVCVFCLDEP